MIVEFLRKFDTIKGVKQDIYKIVERAKQFSRRKMIQEYLKSHSVAKLNLGAGTSYIEGWLNTDISPVSNAIVYLNATKPFPFDDNTFDYIFCEHMIEHISYLECCSMLVECHRILKPNGSIRIATPDLGVIIDLYVHRNEFTNERYIKWIAERYLRKNNAPDDHLVAFVLNNAFHNYGHKFLYDFQTLKLVLETSGFGNIETFSIGKSDDENFRGLESHGKLVGNEEMVAFETMIVEGKSSK